MQGDVGFVKAVAALLVERWHADPQAATFTTGVATWRECLGCEAPKETSPAPGVHETTRCEDGSEVQAYVIDGGAHAWFGATVGELKAPGRIGATDTLWGFFVAHPRR